MQKCRIYQFRDQCSSEWAGVDVGPSAFCGRREKSFIQLFYITMNIKAIFSKYQTNKTLVKITIGSIKLVILMLNNENEHECFNVQVTFFTDTTISKDIN